MAEIIRYSDRCLIKQANSSTTVEAEILNFNENRNMTVVFQKSVKLLMNWNGRMYEGRMAGIDFVSDGPKLTKTQTSIRG